MINAARSTRKLLAVALVALCACAILPGLALAAEAPANTSPPQVEGELVVGSILTCSPGEWTGEPTPTFTYQWEREGEAITGATSSTYTSADQDITKGVSCDVTASNETAAVAATSAPVTVTLPCAGGPISGAGSALASVAVDAWAAAYDEMCAGTSASVSYDSTRSERSILQSWDFFGNVPAVSPTRPQFVGVNGGLTEAQFADAESVLKGGKLVAIPVAQTAIAIVANPPAGCTVDKITNPELESIWAERITNWSKLSRASGACNAPIERVVPRVASQVTSQFKNYLSRVGGQKSSCLSDGSSTAGGWKALEAEKNNVSGPNLLWPTVCVRQGPPNLVLSEGVEEGSSPDHSGEAVTPAEPLTVEATPGSIGFATLPDAEAAGSHILELGNNGGWAEGEATFAPPAVEGQANCNGERLERYARYSVPTEAVRPSGSALSVEWFRVGYRGGRAGVGEGHYPLCMLTFAVTVHGFSKASWESPYAKFLTVNEFIRDYALVNGQEVLEQPGLYMAPLPDWADPAKHGGWTNVGLDVLGAARWAATKISYEAK